MTGYGFGIIGAGVIGAVHAEAIGMVPGARLVAVTDVVPERAKELAGRYGCAAEPVGTQAVAAGKHLVIEKPIDVTLDAADRLIGAARAAGVVITVISQHRFDTGLDELRRLLDSGASAPWCSASRARSGTGPRATTTARRGAAPGPWTAGR